jgi:cellobiose-specific phosphotransferase system component IIA
LPDEEKDNEGLCPICDSKVPMDATKCPECKADLTLFGVKTTEDDGSTEEIDIPDEESIEALLGGIKNGAQGDALFDEIMAAVDKTETGPAEEPGEPVIDEKIEEVKEEVAQVPAAEAPTQEMPPAQEVATAEPPQEAPSAPAAEPVMFECPLCNTLVAEDASTCPGCGAIFAESEEEVPAKEPPAAAEPPQAAPEAASPQPEMAPAAAPKPPAAQPDAAAKQREKALRKELTKCVGDVKPLLAGARQYGINVLEGRKLIDRAIAAGKKRDFKNAITLVKQSQTAIEENFNQHIDDLISQIRSKMGAIQKAGGSVDELGTMVDEVRALVNRRNFIDAEKKVKSTSDHTEQTILQLKSPLREKKTDEASDVNEKVANLVDLIKSGEEVKVNVKGTISLLTEARKAIKESNYDKAEEYLIQAKEDFLKELPKQITDIISNSKPMLYKAKMQGVDIRPSIKLLKEASTALKLNNYLDALDAIKRYRVEMNQYLGES